MNRHIPFGYAVVNGEMTADENESNMVKEIFNMYLNGSSYQRIAEYMESSGVKYHQDSDKWNKNMVKRVLENTKYIGNNGYPIIVETDTFKCATVIIAGKGGKQGKPKRLDSAKEKIYCSVCGASFYRRDKGKSSKPKWMCRKCDSVRIVDDVLEMAITEKLNIIIANPMQICATPIITEPTVEVKRLTNEVNRAFDQKETDRKQIKNLLFELADERYKQCDDGDSERQTDFLRKLLSKQNQIKEFNSGLFEKTVRCLYIGKTGDLILEMVNGQRI